MTERGAGHMQGIRPIIGGKGLDCCLRRQQTSSLSHSTQPLPPGRLNIHLCTSRTAAGLKVRQLRSLTDNVHGLYLSAVAVCYAAAYRMIVSACLAPCCVLYSQRSSPGSPSCRGNPLLILLYSTQEGLVPKTATADALGLLLSGVPFGFIEKPICSPGFTGYQ